MELALLTPPFRHLARCVAYLLLLAGMAAALVLAAVYVPLMSDVFNPHATVGALMLLGLFVLSLLHFFALLYFVPRAAITLYRSPDTRTTSHWTAMAAGVIALALLGTWLNWFYYR